jgi:ribosomal protein L22
MSPAEEKGKDEAETEVVDETTLEETPVEPEPEVEVEETPAEEPVEETPAEETEVTETEVTDAEAPAEEPVAEAQPAPKAARASSNGRPVVRAHAKYVRTSARKARLVADHVRGKSVSEARAILAHTPRAVAEDWEKLLNSAVANAEHNHELLGDDLRILSITADEGPTLKRFRPRAMGRASRIRKRTSHLSIALTPKEQ